MVGRESALDIRSKENTSDKDWEEAEDEFPKGFGMG